MGRTLRQKTAGRLHHTLSACIDFMRPVNYALLRRRLGVDQKSTGKTLFRAEVTWLDLMTNGAGDAVGCEVSLRFSPHQFNVRENLGQLAAG